MGILDWVVLIFSIGFIVLYGIWKNIKNKDLQEYFKGSNKSRWWTIGISVMATQASAITNYETIETWFNDNMYELQDLNQLVDQEEVYDNTQKEEAFYLYVQPTLEDLKKAEE